MKRVATAIAFCIAIVLTGCTQAEQPEVTSASSSLETSSEALLSASSSTSTSSESLPTASDSSETASSSMQTSSAQAATTPADASSQQASAENTEAPVSEAADTQLTLSIDDTQVTVDWESNQAVSDLAALAAKEPLAIDLSAYGGFEQVGPLGTSLTTSDEQITAAPGDIVLYTGNQISIFYGSNSWAYTRLGHITDKTTDELAALLGNGNVSITIGVNQG